MNGPLAHTDRRDWEVLAGRTMQAHLKLPGMNHKELEAALLAMGVEQSASNISAKLRKGSFSAAFMLQVLTAAGVTELPLPRKGQP